MKMAIYNNVAINLIDALEKHFHSGLVPMWLRVQ
jgi:hypothetical protein